MARILNFHKFGHLEDHPNCTVRLHGRLVQETEEHRVTKELLREALEKIESLQNQILEERRRSTALDQLVSLLQRPHPSLIEARQQSVRGEKGRASRRGKSTKKNFHLRRFQSNLPYQQVRRKTRFARQKKLRAAIINHLGKWNRKLSRQSILQLEMEVGRVLTRNYNFRSGEY
ncbi:unnamed protein product [Bursaphelenchus xylophilus]|nr:unnamed protein product [Bursaphelenchus xylophilus]CAG9121695.1 unnamed protein product [Bursaphelenchus xylophilus]